MIKLFVFGTYAWRWSPRAWLKQRPLAIALLLVAALLLWAQLLRQRTQTLLAAQQAALAAHAHVPVAAPATRDFTSGWPAVPAIEALMRAATQSAKLQGLQLRQMMMTDAQPAAAGSIAQADLTIDIRGRYPALKAWLNDVTTRSSAVAIVTLDLRRVESRSGDAAALVDVDATVRLRAYARPTPSGVPTMNDAASVVER